MVTINLSQSGQQKNIFEQRSFFNKGLIASAALLVLIAAIWGGAWLYQTDLDKKIKGVNAEITGLQGGLATDPDADKVADFKKRMDFVLSGGVPYNPDESLREMAKMVVRGAYVDSYEFNKEKKSLKLDMICDNFEVMAQQIQNFKSSDYFANVSVAEGSGTKGDEGQVDLNLSMSIKPASSKK